MLLIGGYTHYPVGIPAKAGEGVALFREENNTVEKIIPAENPSFFSFGRLRRIFCAEGVGQRLIAAFCSEQF